MKNTVQREKITISGIVQGVGFRPFVFSLANELGVSGNVINSAEGVVIEASAESTTLDRFAAMLVDSAPPLSRIHGIRRTVIEKKAASRLPVSFEIRESERGGRTRTLISPDIAVCGDCLDELFNPADRRHRYPFINCTNCGPRFSIIRDIPYDRPYTTMSSFTMCPDCAREYGDPLDRRFHAQPNACPVCGPRLTLIDTRGNEISGDPVRQTAELLKTGLIVAVKGLGGFHLAADAANVDAVNRLRERKRRAEKPFALMAASVESTASFSIIREGERQLLTGYERPIVLLDRRRCAETAIPLAVAPGQDRLGVMLPYAPLHYLLFYPGETDMPGKSDPAFGALVMTSANISEEPIAKDNDEITARMKGIADAYLIHDRAIHVRSDDSVAARIAGRLSMARRSRGFAPMPVFLPGETPDILAVGGELKNTLCVTHGDKAWPSQHIGDLGNIPTLAFFEEAAEHFTSILDIEPEIIAYDLHPGYISTKYALKTANKSGAMLKSAGIQHHHAHIASVMAEHGIDRPVVGLALDGTGYGLDGTIWGCEVFVASRSSFARYAKLRQVPLPGGDAAVKAPWRTAFSHMIDTFGDSWRQLPLPCMEQVDRESLELLAAAIKSGINAPPAGTLGRLFDAAASITGIMHRISYEGQAAIALESAARGNKTDRRYTLFITDGPAEHFAQYPVLNGIDPKAGEPLPHFYSTKTIDTRPLIKEIVLDTLFNDDIAAIAAAFHETVIQTLSGLADQACRETGIDTVALSGGCFQNRILAEGIVDFLSQRGYTVLTNSQVPANDGGISLGQAYIAASLAR